MANESLVPKASLRFAHFLHHARIIGCEKRPTHLSPLPVKNGNPVQVSRNCARVDKKTGKVRKPGLIVSIQQPKQNSQLGRDIGTDQLGSIEKAPYEEQPVSNLLSQCEESSTKRKPSKKTKAGKKAKNHGKPSNNSKETVDIEQPPTSTAANPFGTVNNLFISAPDNSSVVKLKEECKKVQSKVEEALPQIADTEQSAQDAQFQRTAILQKINHKHLGLKTVASGSKDMGTQISAQNNPSGSIRQSLNSTIGSNESNINKYQISEEPLPKTNKHPLTKTKALGPIKGPGASSQVKGKYNSQASSTTLSSSEPRKQRIQESNTQLPVSDEASASALPPVQKKHLVVQKIPTGVQDEHTRETITSEVSKIFSSSNNRPDRPGTVTIRRSLDQPSTPSGNKAKTYLRKPNSSAKKTKAEPSKSSATKPVVTGKLADSNDNIPNQSHSHEPESVSPKNSLSKPPKSSRKKLKAFQNASSEGLSLPGSQNSPAEQDSASNSTNSNKPPESGPEVGAAASASTAEDAASKVSKKPPESTSKLKHSHVTCKFNSKLPRLLRSAERSAPKADRQCEPVSISAPGSGKKPRLSAIPVWVGNSQFQGGTASISSLEGPENEVAGLPPDPDMQRLNDGIGQTDHDPSVYGPGMRLEDVQGGAQILVSYEKLEEIHRAVDASMDNLNELYRIGHDLFSIQGQIRREQIRVTSQTHILESRNRRIYIDDEGCKIN